MSVKVVYVDIAPNAAEDASVSATGSDSKSTLALLPFGANNAKEYATLETNLWTLDGAKTVYDGGNISFWSASLSNDNGVFTTPPVITITFDEQYTSLGLTIMFGGDTYCNAITIAWYQGSTLLSSKDFAPDAMQYYCENTVNSYNKIVITLRKTALPRRRAKLDKLVFGVERVFFRDELRRVQLTEEIDVTGREIPANAMDWVLSSKEDVSYIFQFKQPVKVYDGDELFGIYYVDKADRDDENLYDIICTDAIGVLDSYDWTDAYYSNQNAAILIRSICAGFDVEIDDSLASKTVTGVIKDKTRRGALQQVCFAIGAIADTSHSDAIRIFPLDDSESKEVPEDRTRVGSRVEDEKPVTSVWLTYHSYSTTQSANAESIVIGNTTYYDTKAIKVIDNPNVTASDRPNIIKVEDAYLVTSANKDAIAQLLYDMSMKTRKHKLKFRVVDEKMGEYLETVTPWGNTHEGFYSHATVTLSGFALADAEVTI